VAYKRFVVIGLGIFGQVLATTLAKEGAEVIAIDKNADLVEDIMESVTLAVKLDATDEKALRHQGVDKADVVIIAIGKDFEACEMATMLVQKIGAKRVITRATEPLKGKILALIGAHDIINPEEESATRLAMRLLKPNIVDHIELAEGHSLVQVRAPKYFHGRTIRDINLRKKYDINLVALKKQTPIPGKPGQFEEKVVDIPRPDDVIEPSDILFLVGKDESIAGLMRND
jgi:trk system potassium uptake protein TrkA